MKLICIAGNSGSGKTTIAKMFHDILPSTVLIHADYYMKNWIKQNVHEYKRIFNIFQETVDVEECRILRHNTTLEQFREFISIVAPFVEDGVEKAVGLQANNGYFYAVIEWAGLYKFKLWNRADYRIAIRTQEGMRIKRLTERLIASGKYDDNAINVRIIPDPDISEAALNPNIIIENNYDDGLYINVQRVCKSIMSQKLNS